MTKVNPMQAKAARMTVRYRSKPHVRGLELGTLYVHSDGSVHAYPESARAEIERATREAIAADFSK